MSEAGALSASGFAGFDAGGGEREAPNRGKHRPPMPAYQHFVLSRNLKYITMVHWV